MIALIRIRFNNTPAANVWTDAVMNEWMNPTIPFSLGNYWTCTSLFQADMRYYLFPPVAMDDPRLKTSKDNEKRQYLVDGALAEVTRLFSPDWNLFERAILVFAQRTDLFGGGGPYIVPVGGGQKLIAAAVCDLASPFDEIVQEVGHAFGLDHEIDGSGNEYMSPYSSMSSELYGNARPSFERPVDNRLPKGVSIDTPPKDVQRIIGPYITPVQFYISKSMPSFNDSATVYLVPASYDTAPHSFRLSAVDAAIDSWPVRKPMLAVLPPVGGGDTYFLELRRSRSYDQGLTPDGANGAPVALAVHAVNSQTKRVRYINRLALVAPPGDRTYHCWEGRFTVRLNSFEEDFSGCSVTVGGGDFWKYLGVTIDNVISNYVPQDPRRRWTTVDVSPCFMFPKSPHQYRELFTWSEVTIIASSFGYEKPNYRWFINEQFFDPADNQLQFKSSVKSFLNGFPTPPTDQNVAVQYVSSQNSVKLTFKQAFAGVYATVKVIVNESSQEVLQNLYPDRSVWTGIAFDNVSIEWDQAYIDAQKACAKRIKEISDQYSISQSPVHRRDPGDPGPQFGVDTVALINELVASNPAVANVVINEVARLGNIGKLDVIKKLK